MLSIADSRCAVDRGVRSGGDRLAENPCHLSQAGTACPSDIAAWISPIRRLKAPKSRRNLLTCRAKQRILATAKGMELPQSARTADGSYGVERAVGVFLLPGSVNALEKKQNAGRRASRTGIRSTASRGGEPHPTGATVVRGLVGFRPSAGRCTDQCRQSAPMMVAERCV